MGPDTSHYVAAILNDFYRVRHYWRGARTEIGREKRQQAIHHLGLTVRAAFNSTDDFEPLLAAIVDGGRPRADDPAF